MVQISEQDLLDQHIICPKTKDIKKLLYLQDLGYKLYFMDRENYLCELKLLPKPKSMLEYFHLYGLFTHNCNSLDQFHYFNKDTYRVLKLFPDISPGHTTIITYIYEYECN